MMDKATVFVVDDDEDALRGVARLIKSSGFSVETFSSAQAFLERPPHREGGCIVLDLRMPGLDGLQAQRAFTQAGHSLPIVFLSGHGDVPTSVRAMKAGAVDFLVKPPEGKDLVEAIRRALEKDASQRTERSDWMVLSARYASLTPREREVCSLVATGLRNKQIAHQLGTSEKTIKIHRGQVMQKLAVRSVAELVRVVDRLDAAPGSGKTDEPAAGA